MNLDYIIPDPWKIIEQDFRKEHVKASESLFSIGNGDMGQRANFEEDYSGDSLQGSYIGGIYYPDKTRVGWWKNGYPEYFAKVLNAPNWIGIGITVDGTSLDLNRCKIHKYHRELNMKTGVLERSFTVELDDGNLLEVKVIRFLSMKLTEVGVIKYSVSPINFNGRIEFSPYLDAGIVNEDSNYDEFFWETLDFKENGNEAYVLSKTLKTGFHVCTGMKSFLYLNDKPIPSEKDSSIAENRITQRYKTEVLKGESATLMKYGGYCQSMNHSNDLLFEACENAMAKASSLGFDQLLDHQINAWNRIWDTADITIEGDVKAQQAIRFNIFHLNQTYSGEDSRLNIGPKGFTGEKYGGSTYWDTEAYCIPFYMSTKDKSVAKNLLLYRYNQLDKAIDNGKLLGFDNGAALYPMVTMNGEECHNEWEITFEEIHRNGAMIYAIYNYVNYSGDQRYLATHGLEVMIAICRFWKQRVNFSADKKQFVILGVTGPNEYENNINNNWYTNYLAQWCLQFTLESLKMVEENFPEESKKVSEKTGLQKNELKSWAEIIEQMYFPYSEKYGVFLQQDGFLDKDLVPAYELDMADRPINQKWSWDRILRSPYIKQADVLQGFFFFENHFDEDSIQRHFDFYEPLTVHESSLSPCVHSILACKIGRIEKAYEMYLRTSRLDLDDYNREVHEGLHITSMAGTWMSVVQGFGGMRNFESKLSFDPKIPENWKSYSFKIKYRGSTIKILVDHQGCTFFNESDKSINLYIGENKFNLEAKGQAHSLF